jgi:hypothetical protein
MSENNYEINLAGVRISYPHLFEPFSFQGQGKAKYSAKFLLSKETQMPLVQKIAAAMKALAADSYKDKKLPPADKLCLRDGDAGGREEEVGYWVLSASEDSRPVVVDQKRSPLVEDDDVIYPGCVVNGKIRLWAQDNQFGRRINANLLGVQFVKDGEKLGSGRTRQSADDMFDDVSGAFGDDENGAEVEDPFA